MAERRVDDVQPWPPFKTSAGTALMQSFRHIEAALRLFAGDDCLRAIDRELARLDCRRAVLLCGRSLAQAPALEQVRRGAGDRLAGVCDGVRADSPRAAIEDIAARLAELGADAVIATGGGSAMVTARAAVIALAEAAPLDSLCTSRDAQGRMRNPRLDASKLPILAVPTTPSTAMVKPGAAVFDTARGARLALFDPKTRPQAIFLDPALLMTAPADLVHAAGLNTLCMAVEALAGGSADRMSEALLIQAVRLSADGLRAETDTPARRGDLAMAAILCGRGTDNIALGLATVISHAVAAQGVEGGMAKAVALPHVLRFNRDHIAPGRAALAQALGCSEDDADAAAARLFATLGVPGRLRDIGVPADALDGIAAACMGDWFLQGNPRPVTGQEEVLGLLRDAW